MHRHHIAIVDDDPAIVRLLRANLEDEYCETLAAMDGIEALRIIEKEMPDLVILDIMMPRMDGFEVCKRLREWSQVPVIMLSARGDEQDKVKCLELGADDYVTKPYGVQELAARVRAVLRRTQAVRAMPNQPSFSSNGLNIDFVARRVQVGDHEVKLTPTEYLLLQELVLNAGKVLTHRMLLDKVWGSEYSNETEYLHVFIGRLRRRLEANQLNRKWIITVPTVGYKFQASG